MNWAFELAQAHSLGDGVQTIGNIAHSSRLVSNSFFFCAHYRHNGHSPAASRSILCRSHLTTSTLSLTNDLQLSSRISIVPPSNINSDLSHRPLKATPRISALAIWRTEEVPSAVCCPPLTTVNAGRRSAREIVIHPIRPRFVANVKIPSSLPTIMESPRPCPAAFL